MSDNKLSTPSLKIDNSPIWIIPNSLKVNLGLGTTSAETQSTGGGNVEVVFGDDDSTKVGSVEFDMWVTATGKDVIKKIAANKNIPSLIMILNGDDDSDVMTEAKMTNSPDFNYAVDGKVNVQFKGSAIK